MNIVTIPPKQSVLQHRWARIAIVAAVIATALAAMAFSPLRETVHGWFSSRSADPAAGKSTQQKLELLQVKGSQGLRVNAEAVKGLDIQAVDVKPAREPYPLPPQLGTVNYDNDHLFVVRPRFPGEMVEFRKVVDTSGIYLPPRYRPVRFGDRVKQEDLLAVIWSRELGEKKAALVDAIISARLSKETLARHDDLYKKGVLPLATIKASERQVASDSLAVLTAERTLKMWKLSNEEVEKIKEEARSISEQKKERSSDDEMKWARVEVKAPKYCDDSKRELTIVEKNTSVGDMVDPGRDTPLFRLADLSRLQIWVHPPAEYLPYIREQLKKGTGSLKWQVRFQSDPPNTPPLELDIHQISPSLEPTQHTPMLIGYLPNPDGKFLIGEFLTATIFLPPEQDCVEIPTEAINQVEGQNLVFVESPSGKNEFFIRRVPVIKSFQKMTFVRSRLTPEDEGLSRAEVAKGRRPLQPLLPGERVITRGVVELTSALEEKMSAHNSRP